MVKSQLITALQNLDRLAAEKNRIETEIAKQRRVIAVLQNLLSPEERQSELAPSLQSKAIGLTDAVCDALRATGEWMSTTEIRDCMKLSGFDFRNYKASPNSSISTVLRRMTGKEVETTSGITGTRQYRWRTLSAPAIELEFTDSKPLEAEPELQETSATA